MFYAKGTMNPAILSSVQSQARDIRALAKEIFEHPEIGMQEYFACKVVSKYLEKQGFDVETSNIQDANLPHNCVSASWGKGEPVLAVLAEYDALPGLGQMGGVPYRKALEGPGHGCFHNLSAAAGCGAAVAVKHAMAAEGLPGTIRFLSCPAEENLSGKVLMAYKGYFEGIDAAVFYHGGGKFRVGRVHHSACSNYLFEFHGKTAHAAMDPEKGRSALDAAELMNIGVQYLREHICPGESLHYVYANGGERPNIVPAYAATEYMVRSKDRAHCDRLLERVKRIAKGAAMMTDTKVYLKRLSESYETFHNETLERVMQEAAERLPALEYSEDELQFAMDFYKELHDGTEHPDPANILPTHVEPASAPIFIPGSTDLGDVSQIVPMAQFYGGGEVEGCIGHDWTVTSCAGSEVGFKAAVYGAMAMGEFCHELFIHPDKLKKAQEEFTEQRKNMPPYEARLADTCVRPVEDEREREQKAE